MVLLKFRRLAPIVLFFFVINTSAYIVPEINAQVKANLRSILKRGQALGRLAGITGQWGDSITNTWAYLADIGLWGCGVRGSLCETYEPTWIWMGASRPVGDWDNPLQQFKDENHCNAPGWQIATGSACITRAIPLENPSWTLVMYGTNDIYYSTPSAPTQQWSDEIAEQYKQQMKFLLTGVSEHGIIPCVSTIPPLFDRVTSVNRYNTKLAAMAQELQIPLIDFYEALTAYHPNDWRGTTISSDGIHPSSTTSNWGSADFNSDGYGLRNKLTVDLATKLKAMVFENNAPDGPDYPILDVVSPTHEWGEYSDASDVQFSWSLDGGAAPTEYSYLLDQASNTVPDSTGEGTATSAQFSAVTPGNWYFHVRANSALGWGPATHYLVRIVAQGQIVIQNDVNGYTGAKDACLNKSDASANFSKESFVSFYAGAYDDYKRRMIVRFDDIAPIVSGKTVYSASFEVMLFNSDGDSISLHEVTSSWTPSAVTYNSRNGSTNWTTPGGDFNAQRIGAVWASAAHAYTWLRYDVTSQVQQWVANPASNNGLILCAFGPDWTGGSFIGKEHVAISMRPRLVVNTDPSAHAGSAENKAAGPILGAAFPNPGNPAITIPVTCAPGSKVMVRIFAVNGSMVKCFHVANTGHTSMIQNLTWKGDGLAGKQVSSGIYFVKALDAHNQSVGMRTIMLCR